MKFERYHLELAVEAERLHGKRPDLAGLDLADADLRGANLNGANLQGANLNGAVGIAALYVPGMSSRGDMLYVVRFEHDFMLKAGCFWGTLDAFVQRVTENKGSDHFYIAAAKFLAAALGEK